MSYWHDGIFKKFAAARFEYARVYFNAQRRTPAANAFLSGWELHERIIVTIISIWLLLSFCVCARAVNYLHSAESRATILYVRGMINRRQVPRNNRAVFRETTSRRRPKTCHFPDDFSGLSYKRPNSFFSFSSFPSRLYYLSRCRKTDALLCLASFLICLCNRARYRRRDRLKSIDKGVKRDDDFIDAMSRIVFSCGNV